MEKIKRVKRNLSIVLSMLMVLNLFTSTTYATENELESDVIVEQDSTQEIETSENSMDVVETYSEESSNTDEEVVDESQDQLEEEFVNETNESTIDVEKIISYPAISSSQTSNDVSVNVNAPEGSFEEGTKVEIIPYNANEAKKYADEILDHDGAVAFDIAFIKDGTKVQPKAGTTVNLTFMINNTSSLLKKLGELNIYHIGQSKTDLLKTESVTNVGQALTMSVAATEFSPFVIVKVDEEEVIQEASKDAIKELDVVLSDFNIKSTRTDGKIYQGSSVEINFNWDATSYGTNIHAGDYFVVELPEQLSLTNRSVTPDRFDMAYENGVVLATAVIDRTNNKVTATFNDKVEGKYDVKGTMQFRSSISTAKTKADEDNDFVIKTSHSVVI